MTKTQKSKTHTKEPIISLKNVSKTFGSNHVLRGITLDVYEGESFLIIGGSGSGKSVLLKCILGLMDPDEGSEIHIAGVDVINGPKEDIKKARQKVSMLFQGNALFDSLPVWENICFLGLQTNKMTRAEAQDFAATALPTVGLKKEVADLYPSELSGGMLRRVALARAVASSPEIVFFDEPTTGLDPIMGSVIDDLIRKNVQELGATAVSITHDMNSARRIADRVGMLYLGELIWIGTTKELDTTDNPFVHQFIHGQSDGPIQVQV